MENVNYKREFQEVRDLLRLLLIIELCKLGANREQVREMVGGIDNTLFTKVKAVVTKEESS